MEFFAFIRASLENPCSGRNFAVIWASLESPVVDVSEVKWKVVGLSERPPAKHSEFIPSPLRKNDAFQYQVSISVSKSVRNGQASICAEVKAALLHNGAITR